MVDFYGFHVGKYAICMDPMGNIDRQICLEDGAFLLGPGKVFRGELLNFEGGIIILQKAHGP